MSTARLTFLYPPLFRSIRVCEPAAKCVRIRSRPSPRQCQRTRQFTTAMRNRERLVQRHGKAVEPFLVHGETTEGLKVFTPEGETKDSEKSKELKKTSDDGKKGAGEKNKTTESKPSSAGPLSEETQAAERLPGDADNDAGPRKADSGNDQRTPRQQAAVNTADPLAPLETVLQMPPPETQQEENAAKPPHLQTPPYVHHFDTYTLVQRVEEGGFTTAQSITAMKAVRGLLAVNLDIAQAGLVSKSDVENETYLFRAACSELRTEIQNQRKANEEQMRRERTLLQHEVDILNQKLSQELLTLKDDLKGMFDDRKMSVRMEQRAMESKIQELNYKITVLLNSDSKSEVEGVRWVLTRRSVMTILIMAFMILVYLRASSLRTHEEEMKKKAAAAAKPADETTEDLPAQGAAEILAAS